MIALETGRSAENHSRVPLVIVTFCTFGFEVVLDADGSIEMKKSKMARKGGKSVHLKAEIFFMSKK